VGQIVQQSKKQLKFRLEGELLADEIYLGSLLYSLKNKPEFHEKKLRFDPNISYCMIKLKSH